MPSPFRFIATARRAAALLCLLAPCAGAFAACTTPAEHLLPVGNMRKDAACRFSTIQAAINAATCPGSTVLITPSLTYSAQALTVQGKQIMLSGAATCSTIPVVAGGTQVPVSGSGNGGHSVLTVSGSDLVVVQNLSISGGAASHGGGIDFEGQGTITLANVNIENNKASYGGGVYVEGVKGGSVQLFTGQDVLIAFNNADHEGGGMYADVGAQVTFSGANTSIYSNSAVDAGGGIMAARTSSVKLTASGIAGIGGGSGIGAIDSNHAGNGGGLAVEAIDTACSPYLETGAPDATHPLAITNNRADGNGGGVYFKAHNPGFTSTSFCSFTTDVLNDVRLAGNTASDGAALYLDWDTSLGFDDIGEGVRINGDDSSLGTDKNRRAACLQSATGCAAIENNIAQDKNGRPTNGSTIMVGTTSAFFANRVAFRGNRGQNLIFAQGDNDGPQDVELHNVLITGNTMTRALIDQINDDAPVVIDSSTIANDSVSGNAALVVHAGLTLTNSVLTENTPVLLDYSGDGGSLHVDQVVASNVGGLPLSGSVVQGAPGFANAAGGDFTLADGSMSLDFAPSTPANPFDLAGAVRNVDLPAVPNRNGLRDLGAFERNADLALPVSGAVASASSQGPTFPVSAMVNGDRTGAGWPNNAGWRDNTLKTFPDFAQVTFPVARTLSRVVVTTLQDNYMNPIEPTDTLTFSLFGNTAFDVLLQDPVTGNWNTVQSITGNNLVKRTIMLPPLTQASGVRIVVNAVADNAYARIVELEAFGG